MPHSMDDRRPAITPQLAMRVAVLGGIAFVAFAIIFFRLWFLQVLSGDEYVSQARENRVRKIRVEAPRGNIVDRTGNRVLVRTRQAPIVQIEPTALPEVERELADEYRKGIVAAETERLKAADRVKEIDRTRRVEKKKLSRSERRERAALARAARRAKPVAIPPLPEGEKEMMRLFRRLGRVLDMSPRTIHRRVIRSIADAPYANVIVKVDVPRDAYNYLVERKDRFPGVKPDKIFLRDYPFKTLAAQLFGTVREISPEELERDEYADLESGDRIGKDGIEEIYDGVLRGEPGYDIYNVDTFGKRDDTKPIRRRDFRQGNRLKLTIDLDVQRAADLAIRTGINTARANGNPADAGAYVAMNPHSGEVYAIGSYPSFDANVFAKPISQETYNALIDRDRGAPLINRAIASTYPTGSVFKPITALAALQEGILSPGRVIVDDGVFELGGREFKNARDARYGQLSLAEAMKVSSDVFFYTLGAEADARGAIIQRWAKKVGLGRRSGIDLPGEFRGLIPDRKWRDVGFAAYRRCAARNDVEIGSVPALFKCGGIERPWSTGDNVNLSVGQGDLQATPLQMAIAYATIGNGGAVPEPHLALEVQDGAGRQLQEIRKTAKRTVKMDEANRRAIMEGLRRAATEPGGTSYDVFRGFNKAGLVLYGKTGTVEREPNPDQSWYALYAKSPNPDKDIVIVTTIEKGGFGAETAAPAACRILAAWLDRSGAGCAAGASATR